MTKCPCGPGPPNSKSSPSMRSASTGAAYAQGEPATPLVERTFKGGGHQEPTTNCPLGQCPGFLVGLLSKISSVRRATCHPRFASTATWAPPPAHSRLARWTGTSSSSTLDEPGARTTRQRRGRSIKAGTWRCSGLPDDPRAEAAVGRRVRHPGLRRQHRPSRSGVDLRASRSLTQRRHPGLAWTTPVVTPRPSPVDPAGWWHKLSS